MHNCKMSALFDETPVTRIRRPGGGVKPAAYVRPEEIRDYDQAKARNETAKAELNELEVKIKTGEYGSRAAYRQAAATALASLAQTLRSVPDNLERRLGVSPEVAQEVGNQIDAALDDLASEFEMMTNA
jgi:predicted  nucleic acid-binding Zn-ribbon protein